MKNKIEENINLTKNEEQILFHTLGYDYEPRWNDDRGGYRNYFCTTGNSEDNDYILIQTLVEKDIWNSQVTIVLVVIINTLVSIKKELIML